MRSGRTLLVVSILTRTGVIVILCFLALLTSYHNLKRSYNSPRLVELSEGKAMRVRMEKTKSVRPARIALSILPLRTLRPARFGDAIFAGHFRCCRPLPQVGKWHNADRLGHLDAGLLAEPATDAMLRVDVRRLVEPQGHGLSR